MFPGVKKIVVQPPKRKMGQDGIAVLFCALLTNYPRGTGPVAPLSRGPALHFRVEAAGGGKCRTVDEWGLEHACTFYVCERAQPIGRSQHFWSACLGTQCILLAQGLDPPDTQKSHLRSPAEPVRQLHGNSDSSPRCGFPSPSHDPGQG